MFRNLLVVGLGVAALALPGASQASSFFTYDDATVVSPGQGADPTAFQLTSSSSPGQADGGLEDHVASSLTLADITTLSADYAMTVGGFGGGAPRFTLFDPSLGSAWVYWGAPLGGGGFSNPNPNNVWANTGNYATSSDVRVYVDGFGGITDPNTGITWSQFVSEAGSTPISWVTLDLDGGFSQTNGQQMLVDNFTVNSASFDAPGVPEPTIWSMLILGVAGLGTALRLRPKGVAAA